MCMSNLDTDGTFVILLSGAILSTCKNVNKCKFGGEKTPLHLLKYNGFHNISRGLFISGFKFFNQNQILIHPVFVHGQHLLNK